MTLSIQTPQISQIREFLYCELRMMFISSHTWKMSMRFFSGQLFPAENLPECILQANHEQIRAIM